MFGKISKLALGMALIGGVMSGNCSASMGSNPLLTAESAEQLGKDYAAGTVEDASMITKYFQGVLKRLRTEELMRNLDILYYYSPSIPEVQIACNQVMVTLANHLEKSEGTSAYKILYLLYQSQFDERSELKPNARREVIESMIERFNALVNGDRELSKTMRQSFANALKKDPSFSLYGFSPEWE